MPAYCPHVDDTFSGFQSRALLWVNDPDEGIFDDGIKQV